MTRKRDPLEGSVLGGRFRLVRCLGAGAMGRVYEAHHLRLPRRYAIKILPAGLADRTMLQRFANEAEAASRLHHPNVASVVDHGATERGVPYLVMELCDGETLSAKLERTGALPILEALDLLRQIALGLDHAHRCGLVHRDLKPDNVMIEAEDGRARILDFGLAILPELGDAGRFTARGVAIGSPAFMSPEQARGDRTLDARADLFALGVMMFVMVTGEMPFAALDVPALMRHILSTPTPAFVDRAPRIAAMPDVEALCRRLMEKDRDARPASAAEVVSLIDEAIAARKLAPARPKRFAWFGLRAGVQHS